MAPTEYADAWQRDAAAVAEALFASSAGPPPPERIAWLVDDLAHFLSQVGAGSRLLFRGSLQTVVAAGPVAARRPRSFHALSLDQRIEALERLEHGPLALAVLAVKTMLCLIWYEHPETAIEVGLMRNVTAMNRYRTTPDGKVPR